MNKSRVQLISKNGEPEYAVLPYEDYLALVRQAEGRDEPVSVSPVGHKSAYPAAKVASSSLSTDKPLTASLPPFEPETLVRLRKRAGLSQSQLARDSNLGLMNLIQIETGQRVPTLSMREELAMALGVDQL